jgi:hypothetical protein
MLKVLVAMLVALFAVCMTNPGLVMGDPEDGGMTALIARAFRVRRDNEARLDQFVQDLQTGRKGKGTTVLLTGSSRGLGRGIAAHLVAVSNHCLLSCPNFCAFALS